MPLSVSNLAQLIQQVCIPLADQIARVTGCIQRVRKFTGGTLLSTLIWGWIAHPAASVEQLCQTAAQLGVQITPQGLDQHFQERTAAALELLLQAVVEQVLAAEPVVIPLLQRFSGGVYVLDSSTIALPPILSERWPGCGGGTGARAQEPTAALKAHVRLNLSTGALEGPHLTAGRTHDRRGESSFSALPHGALRVADLGYWHLQSFQTMSDQGVFWLSRLQMGTTVLTTSGAPLALRAVLPTPGSVLDLGILLGQVDQVSARLIAVRVPPKVAAQRRARMKSETRRRGQGVSPTGWELADWTLLVTNVPPEHLTPAEAVVLQHLRWQIELLFKLWKSNGALVSTSASDNPYRVLCEVYAKLIGVVLTHWLLLLRVWTIADRSLVKATQVVRAHAITVVLALHHRRRLEVALADLQRCLGANLRIQKRRKRPSAFQLALDPEGFMTTHILACWDEESLT